MARHGDLVSAAAGLRQACLAVAAGAPDGRDRVDRFFEDAVMAVGVVAMDSPAMGCGVGVIAADDDPLLAPAFELRDRVDDEAFAARWKVEATSWAAVWSPTAPSALVAFRLSAALHAPGGPPLRVGRALIFDAEQIPATVLRRFGAPDVTLWLMPETVMRREAGRAGPSSSYDVLSRCLLVGMSQGEGTAAIERVVTHVMAARQPDHARGGM